MRFLIPAMTLLLAPPGGALLAQDTAGPDTCRYIGPYEVRSILLPKSAGLRDTLTIGLRVLVDCMMKVTRVDTTGGRNLLTISVYGTRIREGCPRPLCPAKEVTHDIRVRPGGRGLLTVIVRNPGGKQLRSSVKIR